MQVHVCTGKSCSLKYSKYIITRLENDIKFCQYKNLEILESSCQGECKKGPNIKIGHEKINYITPVKASDLVAKNMKSQQKRSEKKKHLSQKKK